MGAGRTEAEVAKFSVRDSERLAAYRERLETIADVLRGLVLETPPNVTDHGWAQALPELLKTAALGRRLGELDMTAKRDLLALFAQSAGDYLDGLPVREVAACLGRTEGATEVLLVRAKAAFRARYENGMAP